MVCLGILWNDVQEYKNQIIDEIKDYGEVLDYVSLNLNDNYENFVRDIYSKDSIAQWKVDKKIETMFKCSDNREVTIIFIYLETSKMEYHPFKKRYVYVNLENMKTEIRKKYSKLIEHYFFDNIFHVTDDESEYVEDLKVVKEYCNEQNKTKLQQINTKVLKME